MLEETRTCSKRLFWRARTAKVGVRRRVLGGAPGRIRTSDPQIRSLSPSAENSADFCKPDAFRPLSRQRVKPAFANRKRAPASPRSGAERERLARDLGEAIDDLYRHDAAARDCKHLLDLVQVQVVRAFSLGQLYEEHTTRRATEKRCGPDGETRTAS